MRTRAGRVRCGKGVRRAAWLIGLWLLATSTSSRGATTDPPAWPALPDADGAVEIPAQEWPLRPGPRRVRVLVHYPQGRLAAVGPTTGLMLTLHNWGGTDCVGTANPRTLAQELNVVALCVNYLQSGPQDSIMGPEPYDFGYLQALDALRALWWLGDRLEQAGRPYAAGRLFCTGGSGGGNVSLMANKLAPRTFACVVDLCGMKKLSDDIAFHLPGGSDLNARYVRDPAHPYHLTVDMQELRFLGHREHLRIQQQSGATARVITVHGREDTTCPFADAVEMVDEMRRAGLSVEPRFIGRGELDGQVFTSAGHALGDRTRIVLQVAGNLLRAGTPDSLERRVPSDFVRREAIRYPTRDGTFVIDYSAGYPVGRWEPAEPLPAYPSRTTLLEWRDADGQPHPVKTWDDWERRRRHVVRHWLRVTGPLPGGLSRVPLDVRVVEHWREKGVVGVKLTYQSDATDRVPAWLLVPEALWPAEVRLTAGAALPGELVVGVGSGTPGRRVPAVLCLHQTTAVGKDEPTGRAGDPQMRYAWELTQRGFVTLSPDYPSLGEHAYDFAAHPEYPSGTLKAIWDNIRAVDLLETLTLVDRQRLACLGHSLGGHNAIFTAVVEPRLRVVVSSCGFSSLVKDDVPSWTGPRYLPRLAAEFGNDVQRIPFDFPELIAALAPRPFLAVAATRDSDFDVSGVRDVLAAAQDVYQLAQAKEALRGLFPEAPHSFPESARQEAYLFLEKWLLP